MEKSTPQSQNRDKKHEQIYNQPSNGDEGEQDMMEEDNLEEFIEMLKAHQQKWEDEGNYVEAEMANNRVKELKKQLKERENSELEFRHQNDFQELEETHIAEFNNFNETWDNRMNDFQVHSAKLIQALEEKHQKEIEEFRQKVEQDNIDDFKKSPELLNLEQMQRNLAKQKGKFFSNF